MPQIISNKTAKRYADLEAENTGLKNQLEDFKGKTKESADTINGFSEIQKAFDEDRAEAEASLKTLKDDFTGQLKTLSDKITALEKEKVKITESAKVEIEQVKQEVSAKVNEQVAIKIAGKALTEAELPPKVSEAPSTNESIHSAFLGMPVGKEKTEYFNKHKALLSAPVAPLKLTI